MAAAWRMILRFGLSAAAATTALAAAQTAVAPAAGQPRTIPALQEWRAGEGTWQLRRRARILVRCSGAPGLRTEARLLARDLEAVTGRDLRTPARCQTDARSGDIVLARTTGAGQLGKEGYRLRIGAAFRIVASGNPGVFYGGRTLLQLVRGGDRIPRGRARDWPRYPERGLMVDVGRQYYTPGWIKAQIKELAFLKLNYLHLHLSDNQGFRIESDTHPEIVSAEHLTKRDIREIVAVARRHHVTVVPEIDMPGHMEAALAPHPELQLRNATGRAEPNVLDVTKPAARRFARDLIEEYLTLFPGPYWHVGGDEVLPFVVYPLGLYPSLEAHARRKYGPTANAKDAIHGFINWVDRLVRRRGKTTRMWHDDLNGGSAVTRNPGIVAEWWIDFSPLSDARPPTPQELLDRGHAIMNAGWFPTYYVNGIGGSPFLVRPDVRRAYEEWEVHKFQGGAGADDPPDTISPGERANLGSKLHVWNDNPGFVSQAEAARSIFAGLRVHAQKTWRSPPLTPEYDEFVPIIRAVGHAPGYSANG